MKRLAERTEIARALNFGEYPVLKLDLSDKTEYGFKGCTVRVDMGKFSDGSNFYEKAELYVYRDDKKFQISYHGCFLSKEVRYEDMIRDVESANAPLIKPNQTIVIFVYDSSSRTIFQPYMLKTGDRVNHNCQTPIGLERVELEEFDFYF